MARKKTMGTVENGLANATGCGYADMMQVGTIFNNATPFLLSLNWVQLANTYKSNGFTKTAVDLPVSDAFRNGGFEIDSNTLDAEEILKLKETMSDYGDIETLKECLRWGRLYGGGAVIVSTEQDSTTPFNPTTIKGKEVKLYAVDRWQLSPNGANIQLADNFLLTDNRNTGAITFDKSRVMLYTGQTQPYYLRNQLQGWGASIFEAIIPQLNQYLKANSVILELLDEAKIDIIKINGLADTLASTGGDTKIRKRLEVASNNKNYKSMLAMDVNDDYQQKQLTFGGLDRLLEKIFLLICSCLRIPYSKVFGRGASGFSSGEDDLENYNSMIDADIRVPATKILKQIIDIRCCQLFGRKIPDLIIKWKPLRVLNEKEEQEIKTSKINSYMQLFQAGIMTKKQVAEKLTNEQIILFSDEEMDNLDEEIAEEELTEIKENGKEEKKESILKKIQNSLKAINDRWITIHPHGDAEDEDGNKDYRRLLIKDDETPKEAIDRVYKQGDNKQKEKAEEKTEQVRKNIKEVYDIDKKSAKLSREVNKLGKEYRKELRKTFYTSTQEEKEQVELKAKEAYNIYWDKQQERNELIREYNQKKEKYRSERKELLDELVKNTNIEKALKKADVSQTINKLKSMEKNLDYDNMLKEYDHLSNEIDKEKDKWNNIINNSKSGAEQDENVKKYEKWFADNELMKKRDEVNQRMNDYGTHKFYDMINNALRIDNGGDIKFEVDKKSPIYSRIENSKKALSGVINKKLIPDFEVKANAIRGGRAFASGNTINVNRLDSVQTVIHETAHWLESMNPQIEANSRAFLEYRTRNEQAKSLNELNKSKAYSNDEIAKADNFFNAYCGKQYAQGTEIMSMGLARLYKDPIKFLREDEEYAKFVIANIQGKL